MTTRRSISALVVGGLLAACGSESGTPGAAPVALPARVESSADPGLAGDAVTQAGAEIFAAVAAGAAADDNVVVSPLSIAAALALLEPGANGEAVAQFREILRIDDPVAWRASMNALTAGLENRSLQPVGDDEDPGEYEARVANAAFTQPGVPFRSDYLEVIGTNFDAVIEQLDFASNQEAAADRINEFVADATDGLITDLVDPDDIDPATVLALVNALLLRASWTSQFDAGATTDGPFTLLDGSTVTVPMMQGRGDRSASGDGWVGASKQLVGELRVDVVLPDDGRGDDVAARLADVFAELTASPRPAGRLVMPRFETRVTVGLNDALKSIGLTAPFGPGQLLGLADDPQMVLDKAIHQTWLSVDETGIEAAAATLLLVMVTSAPINQPVDVVLDRPFFLRIVDTRSGATLFIGRIMNPAG